MNIIETDLLVEQFRFPKSKKKRIRAKWAARSRNWRPWRKAFMSADGQIVYMHPMYAAVLRRSL